MTKSSTRLNPALAAAVSEVQPALAAWRARRKPREAIPESLWLDIVRLARSYRPSPVAHALRVNYTSLRRRVLGQPVADALPDRRPSSPMDSGSPPWLDVGPPLQR